MYKIHPCIWLCTLFLGVTACSSSEQTTPAPPDSATPVSEQVGMNPDQTCNCEGAGRKGVVKQAYIDGVPVLYEEVNGEAIYEGDILLSPDQTGHPSGGRTSGLVTTKCNFTWPDKIVYYTIDPTLPSPQRVPNAIRQWQGRSDIRFVARTNQPNYITFRPSSGCASAIGMRGGQQFINLSNGCGLWATVHEIGHALGLWHEQSRNDRDSHIVIHYENMQAGQEINFVKAGTVGVDVGPFDFESLMMYNPYSYSKNGKPTITKLDGSLYDPQAAISDGDSAAVRFLYP